MRVIAIYLALLVLSVVAIGLQGWLAEFGVVDDAYILARYAEHFAEGNELSFNWGRRVEGYTSFLWVFLGGILMKLGLTAVQGVLLLSLVSGCVGLVVVGAFCLQEFRMHPMAACLVSAGLGCLTPWAAWAWSGMETCGFAVLWFAVVWAYVRSTRPAGWVGCGVLAVAAGLARPEGVLTIAVVALYALFCERKYRKLSVVVGTFAILFGMYFVWKWSYFGQPLPNTYYAKVGHPSGALAVRGAAYLWNFLLASSPLWAGTILAGLHRSVWREHLALVALALGILVYAILAIVLVGGDHFAMYRFGVPLLPGLVVLAGAGMKVLPHWLAAQRKEGRRGVLAASTGTLVLCLLANVTFLSVSMPGRSGKKHLARMQAEVQYAQRWGYVGRGLARQYGADRSIATFAIGAIGYFSKMTVWDMQGLLHPAIARKPVATGAGYAGHEKYDSEFILAQRPDVILLINQALGDSKPRPIMDWVWGAASKDLARHPRFQREYRYHVFQAPEGGFIHVYERATK